MHVHERGNDIPKSEFLLNRSTDVPQEAKGG